MYIVGILNLQQSNIFAESSHQDPRQSLKRKSKGLFVEKKQISIHPKREEAKQARQYTFRASRRVMVSKLCWPRST
jgi:hypothetical protein